MSQSLDQPRKQPLAIVIDDDPDLNTAFRMALELAGFAVESVTDSRLALDRIVALLPEIVTLDLNMPHLSGDALLTAIRADERLAGVKVIVITASPHTLKTGGFHDMADVALIKPITLSQIMDIAKRLVSPPDSP